MDHRKTVMMAVGRTHHAWEQSNRAVAQQLGVPESFVRITMFLTRHPGANQKEIAGFSNVSTAAVNQTVKEMLIQGFLKKETDVGDKRCSRLFITEAGREIAEKMRDALDRRDDLITAAISRKKEEDLIALLDRIHDIIREDIPEC